MLRMSFASLWDKDVYHVWTQPMATHEIQTKEKFPNEVDLDITKDKILHNTLLRVPKKGAVYYVHTR